MVPVAGSAYTYAYATAGQLVAWIIGWDLILEYSLAVSSIAVGWSGYFVSFLKGFGITLPANLTSVPHGVNVPAFVIVLVVAALLSSGIRESARANTVLVVIKSVVLVVFVVAGISYVNRSNLTPFIPPNTGEFGHFGWSGILRGAGVIFFAFIGFDAVSTAAQEAKNPQKDMPTERISSIARYLHGALHRGRAVQFAAGSCRSPSSMCPIRSRSASTPRASSGSRPSSRSARSSGCSVRCWFSCWGRREFSSL